MTISLVQKGIMRKTKVLFKFLPTCIIRCWMNTNFCNQSKLQ